MKIYKAKGQGIFVKNILKIDSINSLDNDILLIKYKDGNEAIVDDYNIIADPKAKMEKISDVIANLPKASDRIIENITINDIQIGDIIEIDGDVVIVDENILNIIKLNILGDMSCVACYPLDGNVNDLSGNYNGSYTGSPTYQDGIFGLAFETNNDIGLLSPAHNALVDEIGITFWFMLKNNLTDTYKGIIFNAGNGICELGIDPDDGVSLYYAAGDGWTWEDSNFDLEKNKFYFVAINYNRSTGLYEVFFDNEKIISYSNSSSHKFGDVSNAITFGMRKDSPSYGDGTYYINGLFDQIRIFNRTLSEEEIQQIYNETLPIKKII
jgi:hypothetical protein